jgi:hypothetical protein
MGRMTRLKNHPKDIERLGHELVSRGFHVYAHPKFGGVNPTAHDPKGAHYSNGGEAIDVGRDKGGPISLHEQLHMDRLAVELDARGFAPIWNRGPNDHQDHLHAETRYAGRAARTAYRLTRPRQGHRLTIDGRWGPATWNGVAWALNLPAPRTKSFSGARDVTKALQRMLRTETGSDSLEIDGSLGPATWKALAGVLGVQAGQGPRTTFSSVTALVQVNIVALGRLV